MSRRNRLALLALPLLALTVSCSGPGSESGQQPPAVARDGAEAALESPLPEDQPIAGLSSRTSPGDIWAEPVIADGSVSIPLPVTALGDHFSFEVPAASGPKEFIGYQLDGEFYIRASVCPSCGVKHLDYGAGVLACPHCGCTFDLRTGEEMTGGLGYPEGSIAYFVADGYLKSPLHSLTVAYERTAWGEPTLYKAASKPDSRCAACGG